MDINKLSSFWENYKIYFKNPPTKHQEKYKWPVLKQVSDKWDWTKEDKAQMFRDAFTIKGYNNLWSSGNFYPVDHTNWMFEQFLEETIEVFNLLFDESKELELRIDGFIKYYDLKLPILQQALPDKKIQNHYHNDRRAIALYLFLQYPEKYFLYKFGMIQGFAQKAEIPKFIKGRKENLFRFFTISNEVLTFIKKDSEFLEEYGTFCDLPENYSDDSLHLLVQDFIYSVANHFTIVDSSTYSNVWLYSPGEQAYLWDDFYKEKVMALGWDFLGDLENYESKQELNKAFQDNNNEDANYTNNILANFQFSSEMEMNDLVIVVKGKSEFLGLGKVQSAYYFDENVEEYKSRRKVDWIKKGNWKNSIFDPPIKTLTKLTKKETIEQIFDLLQVSDANPIKTKNAEFMPLNQILYGPPGTGKTFNTVNLALDILGEDTSNLTRGQIKNKYDEFVNEGQIVFTTFHQSMSYEDFIEGIKPLKPIQKSDPIQYDVQDGLFKIICESCLDSIKEYLESKSNYIESEDALTFEEKYKLFVQAIISKKIQVQTKTGLPVELTKVSGNGNMRLTTGTGTLGYIISIKRLKKLVTAFPNPEIITNVHDEIRTVIGGSHASLYYAALKSFIDFEKEITSTIKIEGKEIDINNIQLSKEDLKEIPKFVFIIDEINRGNVSSIFGELITLIEEDKRLGSDNALFVDLPYSKEKFCVPPNLHIIGTMNTADRSVEALDTALRRRFSFVEMLPDPSKLVSENNQPLVVNDINLQDLLHTINKRIEFLVDRDHTIGHAFFIGLDSISALKSTFKNKIIPLLQEYFYGNYYNIELVLGSGFFNKKEKSKVKFALENAEIDSDGFIYEFKDFDSLNDDEFIKLLNDVKIEPYTKQV